MPGTTKQELLNQIVLKTRENIGKDLSNLTTESIAAYLSISRTLASQYLNQLVKENDLLKINTRPVCYLHVKTVEQITGIKVRQQYFESMDDFNDYMKNQSHTFQSLIGYHSSLSDCIEQIKIAAHYPPEGLPLLLTGEKGTGKTLFCTIIFQYMRLQGILDPEARYIRVSFCASNERNEENVKKLLSERSSLIKKGETGLLILEKFHRLERTLQNRIFDHLGRNETIRNSGWRVIYTSEPIDDKETMDYWKSQIPVVAEFPKLSRRTRDERENMIIRFFLKEETFIQKKIRISEKVFLYLSEYDFQTNIKGLQGEIKKLCAKAYLYQKGESLLSVYFCYLSDELLSEAAVGEDVEESRWIYISEDERENDYAEPYGLPDWIYERFAGAEDGSGSEELLLAELYRIQQKKLEYSSQKSSVSLIYDRLILLAENRFHCVIPRRFSGMISELIKKQISGKTEKRERQAEVIKQRLYEYLPAEQKVAVYLAGLVESNLGIKPDHVIQIHTIAGLHFYNQQLMERQMNALIICHGKSTASSMADAVNSIFGKQIFEALDMPFDTTVEVISETVKNYIHRSCVAGRLLILVDTGALEYIGERLQNLPGMMIGIINHVSTGLAVHVGNMIMEQKDMITILKSAVTESTSDYTLIERQVKEYAILFIGEKNTKIAEKMKALFWESLPDHAAVTPLFWNAGEEMGLEAFARTSNLDILFTLGMNQYRLDHVPHLDISEVIALNQNIPVYERLRACFSEQEIQHLLKSLLKNFSMQNIMQQLTILNPVTLMNRIETSLERLQCYLDRKLKSNTLMGLYLHLSFLMERLVKNNPIDSYLELDKFEKENAEFIKIVQRSFQNLSEHYYVEIPLSEIAYIYDLVKHDGMEENLRQD